MANEKVVSVSAPGSAAREAEALRKFFQVVIREKVTTRAEKQALAEALDLSIAAIEQLAYKGKGSFDTYAAALLYLFRVDAQTVKNFILDQDARSRRVKPTKESDKIWFDLDTRIPDEQKTLWASLMRASVEINLALTDKRRSSKKPK